MVSTRWSGPTVGGVDCNGPETAVWTAVFAAVAAIGGSAPQLLDSEIAERAHVRADWTIIYLRRAQEKHARLDPR